MRITFLGGTGTVTGSKYLLETNNTKLLIDCGLFQGYKVLRERNRQTLPIELEQLDAIILTHAHLDHSGYIPALYQQGFRGPVYTHHATKALCSILLEDSGQIQESDARYFAKHKLSKHEKPKPLYDRQTAVSSMSLFHPIEFNELKQVGDIHFNLQPAGHILGAASIIVEAEGKRIGFSGDVGRPNDIFMRPPMPLPSLDLLLLESTYGNRRHESNDVFESVAKIVCQTAKRGGAILVPSFAVGRAQVLQHIFATLIAEKRIPDLPIYLDSPMAINVSDIYCQHSKEHKLSQNDCEAMCDAVTYTQSVEDSKALADITFPHIIIAGSGMATGGRILHHFKRLLGDPKTTVLFSGYQAGGTRGAKMLDGLESIKIHGSWVPVRANVSMFSGLSGHADYMDLGHWLEQSSLKGGTAIKLVHGNQDALEGLCDHLKQTTHFDVSIAVDQETINI